MFPGRDEPDYGVFVKQIADALEARGHVISYAVSERRSGGPGKHVRLAGTFAPMWSTRTISFPLGLPPRPQRDYPVPAWC